MLKRRPSGRLFFSPLSSWGVGMNYIKGYTEEWVRDFLTIADCLEGWLFRAVQIHHVGSTSVPGMVAKDIIDVDIECAVGEMERVIERLGLAGYEHTGDQGIPTREAFRPVAGSAAAGLRAHHLYACEADSPELHRHLALRDYLRAHPAQADWLAAEKVRVDAAAGSREAYIEGKAGCYETIVAQALAWAAKRARRV